MGRYVALAVTAFVLSSAGCSSSSAPGSGVRPQAVSFHHPDEVNKAGGFMALADRRIFAAMAFVNATGYDEEFPGYSMHPVRVKVRRELEKRLADKPDKLKAYRDYYENVIVKGVPLFAYKSFVLTLSADYPFGRTRPDQELAYPYTAKALQDLPQMLNDFWVTVNLGDLWEQVKPDYVAEIQKYDVDKMNRQMAFLWTYLRMERHDPATIVVQIPDLLSRHRGAMGAGYEQYYYSVDNPSSNNYGLNVHEYLHTVVNPLVQANYPRFRAKLDAYYMAGKYAPAVKTYRQPVTFVFECMVGALDRRIGARFENDPKWIALREEEAAYDTKAGLNLTLPFYKLLAEYEQSGKPFDQFLPTMLEHLPEYK